MPVIARFMWVLVAVLLVLTIYTSLTQNEQTVDGGDTGPTAQQTTQQPQNRDYARDTPVADDPPIPTGGRTSAQATQAQGMTARDSVNELRQIIPMSVDDAYAAIPHKRTTYSAQQSKVTRTEATYLEEMFALTDQMTAARVAVLTRLYYGHGGMGVDRYNRAFEEAMKGFNLLQPPAPAVEAHRQIVKAIREQHAFVNEWNSASGAQRDRIKQNYGRQPKVQSSHKRLLSAYSILMRAYSHDSSHNKTSFYDHLCALDFI